MARDILNLVQLGTLGYEAALSLQQALVCARQQDRVTDTLLMLEHPHVYTLGRGASEANLRAPVVDVPVFRVSRGGQANYHGPGQLVAYPIVKLEGAARDVHRYLRDLEQVVIDALARCGIDAGRRESLTGVWVGRRKIASIGVGIRRWVTLHGFAINVTTDLSFFNAIVPCGIDGCVMTSIAAEGGIGVSVIDFAATVAHQFAKVFDYEKTGPLDVASLPISIGEADRLRPQV